MPKGYDDEQNNLAQLTSSPVVRWGGGAILALVLFFLVSPFYWVTEGTRGVLVRNGAYVSTQEPGFHFKIPLIDSVTTIEVRNMAKAMDVHVYSSDTQQYTARVTVNFDLDTSQVERIYKQEGVNYAERRLVPIVERTLKEVAGKFNAQRTIQERDIYGAQVRDAVRNAAKVYGVNVTEVQITNIDFTDQFEKAIETAMLAKAKVEEERNILDQQRIKAERVVVEATAQANANRERAKGEADAKITQAKAEAERISQTGLAEAKAIEAKTDALAKNPALVEYMRAEAAKRWNGVLPTTFVPGSALPVVDATGTLTRGPAPKQ